MKKKKSHRIFSVAFRANKFPNLAGFTTHLYDPLENVIHPNKFMTVKSCSVHKSKIATSSSIRQHH